MGLAQAGGIDTDGGRLPAVAVIVATGPRLPDLVPSVAISAARRSCMRTKRLPLRVPGVIEEMSWPEQDELGRDARPPGLADIARGGQDNPVVEAFALVQKPDGDALIRDRRRRPCGPK